VYYLGLPLINNTRCYGTAMYTLTASGGGAGGGEGKQGGRGGNIRRGGSGASASDPLDATAATAALDAELLAEVEARAESALNAPGLALNGVELVLVHNRTTNQVFYY
jgi:hypothetical protein